MAKICDADSVLDGRGMVLGSVANCCLDSFPVWVISQYSLGFTNWLNSKPIDVGAIGWSIKTLCKSIFFPCRTLQLMMSAVPYDSNQNGGSLMGVGGDERIASNLISRLPLVSDPLSLFVVRFWWTCMMLLCVPSLFRNLWTVVLMYVPLLVWTLQNMVLLCVPSLFRTFCNGVLWVLLLKGVGPGGFWCSWVILILMFGPDIPWC